MKYFYQQTKHSAATALLTTALCFCSQTIAASLPALVDDFNDERQNSLGIDRQFYSDTVAGGATQSQHNVANGIIHLTGEIAPPRGQPGWASSVLLLDAQGLPQDASCYDGISMKVRINSGAMSISANSTEVTNFDYHAAPVVVTADGKFHEVKIPFESMKRAWSEQTRLNSKTINSLSIVAFGMQEGPFDFEIDQVAFY